MVLAQNYSARGLSLVLCCNYNEQRQTPFSSEEIPGFPAVIDKVVCVSTLSGRAGILQRVKAFRTCLIFALGHSRVTGCQGLQRLLSDCYQIVCSTQILTFIKSDCRHLTRVPFTGWARR